MRDVLRLGAGARVALLGSDGAEYEGRIVRFDRDRAIVQVNGTVAAARERRLILATAIIKGARMDFIVEKAAELGASELWPILCARGIVRSPGEERLARWRRIAQAAAKQSLASRAILLREPRAFADLIREAPGGTLRIVCTIGAEPIGSVLRRSRADAIMMLCGPEGDLDERERESAVAAGFVPAGLGPNRLRSETAAIAALSIAADFLAGRD